MLDGMGRIMVRTKRRPASMNPIASTTLATISPFAALGFAAVIAILVRLPMRLLGRWLERTGGSIEQAKHGPLPGAGSEPSPQARNRSDVDAPPAETERYDPFNAG